MYFPISSWAVAFAVTMAVEIPIILWTLHRGSRDLVRLVVIVFVANLATHLAVWYVLTQLLLINTPGYIVAAEAWAVAVEAAVYWAAFQGLSVGRAILISLLANAASFVSGLALGLIWPEVF